MAYVANPSDSSKPIDQDIVKGAASELRALKDRINQLAAAAALPIVPATNQSGLTHLLYPSVDGGWRDIYRAGWRPAFFNQQWGGSQWGAEMVDGATSEVYKFEAATGNIEDNTGGITLAAVAAATWRGQGFKVAESGKCAAIWVKLLKNNNPANNLQLQIHADDGTGKPLGSAAIPNGAATGQVGKIHTTKADGEWYRFVFVTPPDLVAGTQYHFTVKSSGAVDATHYWALKATTTGKYPFGSVSFADGTPTWSITANEDLCFLVELDSVKNFLQRGSGTFDSTVKMYEGIGNQINQSKALVQPLRNFFDGVQFTALHRVSNAVVNKPIADYLYGLDHDRITLAVENTGFASIKVYDKTGAVTTITGTSNITTAGTKDIAVVGRIKGDGADYMQLWVNGVKEAEVTLQTFLMNAEFRDFGHAWLGGGFSVTPVWTQKLDMSTLPSANGWAWTGTALEANAMLISGGKLRQNRNGYAAADTGYYQKNAAAFSNANGWAVQWKCRVATNTNTNASGSVRLTVWDGTKTVDVFIQEYFVQTMNNAATVDFNVQGDFKSQENEFLLTGKGSDYYLYINGKLAIDGTGKLTVGTASNQIAFGDIATAASESADVVWDYLSYYTGGTVTPQVNSGMLLHEYAYWSGNKSLLLPSLYNAGVHQSVKQFCGVEKNYIDEVNWVEHRTGVTPGATFGVGAGIVAPEMETYVIGNSFETELDACIGQNTAGAYMYIAPLVDGALKSPYQNVTQAVSVGEIKHMAVRQSTKTNIGLHKVEGKAFTSAGTATVSGTQRQLTVTSKA